MASNESHILVINSGSSSLKFTVFDPASEEVVASGIAERLGTDGAGLKLVDLAQKRHEEALPMADHRSALLRIFQLLTKSSRFGITIPFPTNTTNGIGCAGTASMGSAIITSPTKLRDGWVKHAFFWL
jgi:hypothetical protein